MMGYVPERRGPPHKLLWFAGFLGMMTMIAFLGLFYLLTIITPNDSTVDKPAPISSFE